ncbi:MAG: sulfatase-like hydrolase/transferase, partial [Pirellulaceae bacterium]
MLLVHRSFPRLLAGPCSLALPCLLAWICSLPLQAVRSAAMATDKPNIVYLVIDELGYYEPSYMGNPQIQTPNIDRLAAEGVYFTNALAGSSVCAP